MMKSKLCICIAELHYRKQFAYSYAAFRSISIAWLNTLRVITFSEKLAFPRGAALRITSLYAKNVSTAFAQGCTECNFLLLLSRLEKSKSRYICDTGWNTLPVFISKQKGSHYARPCIYKRYFKYPLKTELV